MPASRSTVFWKVILPKQPIDPYPQEPFHARHKVRIGRLDNHVKVITHQTERMHLPIGFVARLAQRIPETLPVPVILKNGVPLVPAIHHRLNRWESMAVACLNGPGQLSTLR